MATKLEDYDNSPEEEGTMVFDGEWYALEISPEFHERMLKLAEALDIRPNKRPHVSVIKGEATSLNKDAWGKFRVGDKIKFKFDQRLHYENGLHVWINIYSKDLCKLREHFGLVTLRRAKDDVYLVNFHMTLGKLKEKRPAKLREQYRLCPQSHIDVETGMQHL